MSKVFLIVSNDIQDVLLTNDIQYIDELNQKLDINIKKVNTPLTINHQTRDIVQVLDALNSLNEIYEFVKYMKQWINIVKFAKTKYIKIYQKNTDDEYTLKKKIDLNRSNQDFMEDLQEVVVNTADYVFEFTTSLNE